MSYLIAMFFFGIIGLAIASKKGINMALGFVAGFLLGPLVFLMLFLATWALEGLQRLRNSTDLWSRLPLPFLGFKLAAPLLLFFALLPVLRRLRVPLRGGFYSAAAQGYPSKRRLLPSHCGRS